MKIALISDIVYNSVKNMKPWMFIIVSYEILKSCEINLRKYSQCRQNKYISLSARTDLKVARISEATYKKEYSLEVCVPYELVNLVLDKWTLNSDVF